MNRLDRSSADKRRWLRILMVSAALILGVFGYGLEFEPELIARIIPAKPGFYTVASVDDGDTISVLTPQGTETVRLIGIDTPEKNHPNKPVQCFAEAASRFTSELVAYKEVRLEAEPTESNRDKYGRLLRYVYLPDGTLINGRIIEEGYGFAYTVYGFSKQGEFLALQEKAKQQKRGLWRSCDVQNNGLTRETNPA